MSGQYPWRDPRGLARFALITLGTAGAARGAHTLLLLGFMTVWRQTPITAPAFFHELDVTERVINVIEFLGLFVSLLASGLWAYRVSVNAHSRRLHMAHGPWATIFWYIVPFASLIMPCIVLLEIWDVSAARGARDRDRPLVPIWWGVFIIWNISSALTRTGLGSTSLGLLLFIEFMGTAAVLLYLQIVRRITAMQTERSVAQVFGDEEPQAVRGLANPLNLSG